MKNIVRNILLIIAISVFTYSAYKLINIYLEYKNIDDTYNEISEEYTQDDTDNIDYLDIDFNSLLKRNNDVKAWINIPDTSVNYPVLQGENNSSYIHSDIDKNYFRAGSIFIDSSNTFPFQNMNTIIYGHNMKNGSMFSDIKSYREQEFADQHPYIYIYLPNNTVNTYRVVSAHIINDDSILYQTSINDLQIFYQEMLATNTINTTFDQSLQEPMLMLSTCTASGGQNGKRSVVHAVLESKNKIKKKS